MSITCGREEWSGLMPPCRAFETARNGRLRIKTGRVFDLKNVVETHCMEDIGAGGKIVVLT
jgi:hypothetical protein